MEQKEASGLYVAFAFRKEAIGGLSAFLKHVAISEYCWLGRKSCERVATRSATCQAGGDIPGCQEVSDGEKLSPDLHHRNNVNATTGFKSLRGRPKLPEVAGKEGPFIARSDLLFVLHAVAAAV